jgi:hypothetical protein
VVISASKLGSQVELIYPTRGLKTQVIVPLRQMDIKKGLKAVTVLSIFGVLKRLRLLMGLLHQEILGSK